MHSGPQPPYGSQAQPAKTKTPLWIIIIIVVLGGGVVLVGSIAAIGIFGVRRYLGAAKTAEAKNSIGAIARGARAAYDRERDSADGAGAHRLCSTAIPVPTIVPSGMKYMPAATDFDSGDENTGWKCLKFSMMSPIYFQYHYHQGSGYLGTAASPGPKGFEAAARGDLDGDGTTSLFALSGTESGGAITVSPTIEIVDEQE